MEVQSRSGPPSEGTNSPSRGTPFSPDGVSEPLACFRLDHSFSAAFRSALLFLSSAKNGRCFAKPFDLTTLLIPVAIAPRTIPNKNNSDSTDDVARKIRHCSSLILVGGPYSGKGGNSGCVLEGGSASPSGTPGPSLCSTLQSSCSTFSLLEFGSERVCASPPSHSSLRRLSFRASSTGMVGRRLPETVSTTGSRGVIKMALAA